MSISDWKATKAIWIKRRSGHTTKPDDSPPENPELMTLHYAFPDCYPDFKINLLELSSAHGTERPKYKWVQGFKQQSSPFQTLAIGDDIAVDFGGSVEYCQVAKCVEVTVQQHTFQFMFVYWYERVWHANELRQQPGPPPYVPRPKMPSLFQSKSQLNPHPIDAKESESPGETNLTEEKSSNDAADHQNHEVEGSECQQNSGSYSSSITIVKKWKDNDENTIPLNPAQFLYFQNMTPSKYSNSVNTIEDC